MPDTGAPYNIPFLDGTEIVRDYPQLSEDLADAIVNGLDGIPVLAGIGSNVVQTVKTNTFGTSSTSFTAVTGMTATITPTSTDSKILVIAFLQIADAGGSATTQVRLTGGNASDFVGDANGSRTRVLIAADVVLTNSRGLMPGTGVYLDAPSTDSPVTYGVEMRVNTGTGYLNRTRLFENDNRDPVGPSSLTLIEVAA